MNAWHNLWLPSLFTDTETEDSTFDDFYLSEKEAKIVELHLLKVLKVIQQKFYRKKK